MEREDVLVTAAQQGDLRAFNQLVLEYQGLAFNVAYRILGNADGAADATQDSFLKAYRSLSSYRGGSFRARLLRVLTNTCYDQLRGAPATTCPVLGRRRRRRGRVGCLVGGPGRTPGGIRRAPRTGGTAPTRHPRPPGRPTHRRAARRRRGPELRGDRLRHRHADGNGQVAPEPGAHPPAATSCWDTKSYYPGNILHGQYAPRAVLWSGSER